VLAYITVASNLAVFSQAIIHPSTIKFMAASAVVPVLGGGGGMLFQTQWKIVRYLAI
jgi:hypothetical protein